MSNKKYQNDETQGKLDRLARIDEKNRIRVRRYHEKVKKEGGKQLSAIISGEAYETICRIRDAGVQAGEQISFGKIIERALAYYTSNQETNKSVNDNIYININDDNNGTIKQKLFYETQTEIPAPMPGYLIDVSPNIPIEERHTIILRIAEDFPGRKNAQTRIDLLNAAGILLGGKPWEKTKQFADQLSISRRWAKKQTKKS